MTIHYHDNKKRKKLNLKKLEPFQTSHCTLRFFIKPIEGFILLHPRGYYALYQPQNSYPLRAGDRLAVNTGDNWIEMEVAHNFEGYYLRNEKISFHHLRVYARLV